MRHLTVQKKFHIVFIITTLSIFIIFFMEDQALIVVAVLHNIVDSSSSSSSESDEDDFVENEFLFDENGEIVVPHEIPRVEGFVERVIYRYTAEEFRQNFRVRPETFEYLLTLIGSELEGGRGHVGRYPIPAEEQLFIALWVLATPDSYRSVTAKFGHALATAWHAVERVVRVLCQLKNEFIRWPNHQESLNTAARIQETYGFPGALGAVDGTHIRICAPKRDRQSYINRKGHHSIQLQVVCNDRLEFLHCFVGLPGSVHDMRVFNHSGLQQKCNQEFFPNNTHLLGDAAYTLQQHVIVPFRDNGHLTVEQEYLNHILSSSRMIVERAIGLLKMRWRYLMEKLPMTRTGIILYYILSCCILHNICLLLNDDFDHGTLIPENENENEDAELLVLEVPNNAQEQGRNKRDTILEQLNRNVE